MGDSEIQKLPYVGLFSSFSPKFPRGTSGFNSPGSK